MLIITSHLMVGHSWIYQEKGLLAIFPWVNQEMPEKSLGFRVESLPDVHHQDTKQLT